MEFSKATWLNGAWTWILAAPLLFPGPGAALSTVWRRDSTGGVPKVQGQL